jgi:uncharacterized membrane protein YfcA
MNVTLLYLIIGLGAGVMSGLFGIGGGIVIGPALILIAGFIPVMATGTSLAALILPVGLLGAMEYYKRGHINSPAALWIGLGLFIGAWFGAKLAQSLSGPTLQKSFAVFLVLVAIRVWWKA